MSVKNDLKQKFLDDVQCRRGTPLGRLPSQPILKLQRSEARTASTSTGAVQRRAAWRLCSRTRTKTLRFCLGVETFPVTLPFLGSYLSRSVRRAKGGLRP